VVEVHGAGVEAPVRQHVAAEARGGHGAILSSVRPEASAVDDMRTAGRASD
jgi:hypothetical protein